MKAETKGVRTYQRIIKSAFKCIARDGYHATTFQTIADEAQCTQPLVVRYFGSKDNIFPLVLEHFLDEAKAKTLSSLRTHQAALSAENQIRTYLAVSLAIFQDYPEMKAFYMAIYSQSNYDVKIKSIHKKLKADAIQRIAAILQKGVQDKEFKLSQSLDQTARTIHNTLTGLLLNWNMETKEGRDALLDSLTNMIITWVKK